MSLPPGFLDELRNRVSISQVVGRKVVWDTRKSNQAKGDWWAPCPFHQEKSASFHVDDRKGFYYCFGCQAKGDAVSFVRETENVSFMEAVEILAREAGMTMPARDPQAAQRADRRTQLAGVMDEAIKYYRLQLAAQGGSVARDYIARRELSAETVSRFEIGWAPDQRNGLFNALTQKGISPDLIVDAGLCIRPDDGGAPYDRFRGRVIFPIRDARGRGISLGGRSLDPNARAKYLNGPETELFDKGRNLFNHGPAREACGKKAPLIVCEGYMDVIALSQAGFGGAVAPLGTAVTEEQLHMVWRIHNEPIIALDGDSAGVRAALRVIDLALPLLEAGKALRFAMLPTGKDPDDLIKASGPSAMQKVLDGARPMVDLLWQRETEGQVFDSPERRAALDVHLRAAIMRIADPSIRHHYEAEVKNLRKQLFGFTTAARPFVPDGERRRFGKNGFKMPALPLQSTRATLLATTTTEDVTQHLREALILAIFALHPTLIGRFENNLETLDFGDHRHKYIASTMLGLVGLDREEIAVRLTKAAGADLENIMDQPHVRSALTTGIRDDVELAAQCLASDLTKLTTFQAWQREIRDAAEEIEGLADEGVTWRITEATRALEEALKPQDTEDRATVRATNGVELDKEELEKSRALLDTIDFSRGGRGSRRN